MDYEVELALFCVVATILLVSFALLFFYKPVRNFFRKHFTIRAYYKTVKKVTYNHDFYLINKFSMSIDGRDSGVHIDHIMFGDKFIYIIKDYFFKGAMAAKEEDESWVYFPKKNKKCFLPNPMAKNLIRCERLAAASGLDRSYFISIILVNDDVFFTPIKPKTQSSVIVPLSKLDKFISYNEEREDIEPFTPDELQIAVNDLAELNSRDK